MATTDINYKELLQKWCKDASKWKCPKCNEICDPDSPEWRFNGKNWEHFHDYPLGHVVAEKQN